MCKEVIHLQVPLQIPCVDLTRLAEPRFDYFISSLTQTQLGWFDRQCVQGAGTYSPYDANARLLGISLSRGQVAALDSNKVGFKRLASPFGVATRCFNHCMPRVAQKIRGIQTYRCLHLPPAYAGSPLGVLAFKENNSNRGHRSRSFSDLTEHLTARADGGHAPPLSVSSATFSRTFILLSLLVRFPAYNPIKPQHSPLVVLPRQFL